MTTVLPPSDAIRQHFRNLYNRKGYITDDWIATVQEVLKLYYENKISSSTMVFGPSGKPINAMLVVQHFDLQPLLRKSL